MWRSSSKFVGSVSVALVLVVSVFAASGTTFGAEKLNRSIYVPVQISLDEPYTHAVLYQEDEAIRSLPGKQIFQFTYYPRLHKVVPEAQQLQIIAHREDGTTADIGLVVTSCTVYIGDKSVPLDMNKMLKDLRHRADYHYEPVKLILAGSNSPSRVASENKKDP